MGKSKRENNLRKYTGGGPRPDLSKVKKEEAETRQAEYSALTIEQKLEALKMNQARCGGASKKQHAKLMDLIEKKNVPSPVAEVSVPEKENVLDEKKHLK